MSEVPPPSGNWYAGQPYNQNNWDTQVISLDNILDNGYLIVSGNTTLANLAVSGNAQLASLGVTGTSHLAQLQFTGGSTTGNLDFGNTRKITSLANGTNTGDSINKGQMDTANLLKMDKANGIGTGLMTLTNGSYSLELSNPTASGNLILESLLGTGISFRDITTHNSHASISGSVATQNLTFSNGAGLTQSFMLNSTSVNCLLPTKITGGLTMTTGGSSPIDMSSNNITNCGSLTLSLPITQNAAASVYSTTLNGSTTQIGGYNLLVGTAIDLFTAGSSTTINLLTFTLPSGIWNVNTNLNIVNNSPNNAVITRTRYGFNNTIASITSPYTNTTNKQDMRSLSLQNTGGNSQTYNSNELLINATGANITLYFNANIVWTGPTAIGFTAQSVNLNLVRIA